LPSQLHKHHHIEHFPRMGRIAGWQYHFDDQQSTSGVHRLADMAENRQALIFAPVMDNVREYVSIRTGGDACEEIAGLNRHPIAHALGIKQRRCIFHDVWPVEQDPAGARMTAKHGCQHVTGGAANVDNGSEN
jgi:hypothetical protein